jgi:hypothetical protein
MHPKLLGVPTILARRELRLESPKANDSGDSRRASVELSFLRKSRLATQFAPQGN